MAITAIQIFNETIAFELLSLKTNSFMYTHTVATETVQTPSLSAYFKVW